MRPRASPVTAGIRPSGVAVSAPERICSARSISGRSTILPSTWTTDPAAAFSAPRMRRAQSISPGRGKARLDRRDLRGMDAELGAEAQGRARVMSAAMASGPTAPWSRRRPAGAMGQTGASPTSPRAGSSTAPPPGMRASAPKSRLPKANRATPLTAAEARRFASPATVSTSATRGRPGSRAATPARVSGSALGTITAAPGIPASAARSSSCHGVSPPLIRTMPVPPPANQSATWARASDFSSGPTASSRSRITAPAPAAAALAKRSGRWPGTKR